MANNPSSSSGFNKWDSAPNPTEQSTEPVFKTPLPFWNQALTFRRPRQADAFNVYSYQCDLVTPDLSYVIGTNPVHHLHHSSRYLPPASKLLMTDPNMLNSFARGSSYWGYVTPEVGHELGMHRKLHNPQIDPMSAPYSYGGHDVPRRGSEQGKMCTQKERSKYYESHNQNKREHERHYVKNNPLLGSLLYTDWNKEDFKHDIKYSHHSMLNWNHSSHAVPEESKWQSEKRDREELPLLVWREDATNYNSQSNDSSSAPWVLRRFEEGSLVELEGGQLKRVEDLKMEDWERCAQLHPKLMLNHFTVLKISPLHTSALSCLYVEIEHDHSQLSLEVSEGLPFFVCGHGWSSCNPQQTSQTCRLQCRQLKVGDVCLALKQMPSSSSSSRPDNQSRTKVDGDDLIQKRHAEKTSTLKRKDKPRKRHFTAPELREFPRYTTPKIEQL